MQPCIACRAPELRFFGRRVGYEYWRCGDCGTPQLVPMPTSAELSRAYAEEYAHAESAHYSFRDGVAAPEEVSAIEERYHTALVDTVIRLVGSGPVLDVGCGYGGVLTAAKRRGLTWQGIDASVHAVEHCKSEGLDVRLAQLDAVESRYSAIVLSFVLEHLPDYDSFFNECRRHLTDDGFIISLHPVAEFACTVSSVMRFGMKTRPLPAVDSSFKPPWHVALPSERGLHAAAARNQFRVASYEPAPIGRFGTPLRRGAQLALSSANAVGWRVLGTKWPLIPAYIAALQRTT
jgi:SAM-dependent methyltransferase